MYVCMLYPRVTILLTIMSNENVVFEDTITELYQYLEREYNQVSISHSARHTFQTQLTTPPRLTSYTSDLT